MSEPAKNPLDDVEHHARWIRQLAKVLVNDPGIAEDLAQDTLAAALQQDPKSIDQPRSWMSMVLRNAALQYRRSEARRRKREAESHGPAALPGPAELAERLDTERILTEELAQLEEPFRSALMLRFYEDLEPTEIAGHQGVPAGTVRWRLKRAKDLLRERLDARCGDRRAWATALIALAHGDGVKASVSATGLFTLGALTMKYTISGVALLLFLLLAGIYMLPGNSELGGTNDAAAIHDPAFVFDDSSPRHSRTAENRQELPTQVLPSANRKHPLSLRVIDKDTKAPIPGQTLIVFSGTLFFRDLRAVSTDGDGEVMIDGLPVGHYKVSPGGMSFELRDGGSEVSVELEARMKIEGLVTDSEGRPMADAELRYVHCNTNERGGIIALSGANGRFRVTGYEHYVLLYASKPGFSPSVIYDPSGRTDKPPKPIHFVLRPCQTTLNGLVLDVEGRPVADAKVRVQGSAPPVEDLENEKVYFKSRGRSVVAYHTQTDAYGQFEVGPIRAGNARYRVTKSGGSAIGGTTSVSATGPNLLRITLEAPAIVRGRVTDLSGKPIAGAHVSHDWDSLSWSSSTLTDRDGSYRLEGLVPGLSSLKFAREGYHQNYEKLGIRSGESINCDSVLRSQPMMAGRLVDNSGAALPLWRIYPARNGSYGVHLSKTDGTFEFPLYAGDDTDVELAAYPPVDPITQRQELPPRLLERVDAQEELAPYRPTLASSPSASFEIALNLPEGFKPDVGSIVIVCDYPAYHRSFPLGASSRFKSIEYSPGAYTLSFRSDVLPYQDLGTYELRAETRRDLGSVQIVAPVPVDLRVNCADTARLKRVRVIFQNKAGKRFYGGIQDKRIIVEPLLPGEYSLSLFGHGVVQERRQIHLVGPPVRQEIELVSGLAATLRLHFSEGVESPESAQVLITNNEGKTIAAFDDYWNKFDFGYRCGLLPGTYQVEVATSNGLRATATWFVDSDTKPSLDIGLRVR